MKVKKILLALFSILLITKGLSQTQVMNPYLPGTTCATCIVNNNSNPRGGGNNNTIMNGNGVIATSYVNTQCGLGYVHGKVKLGKRGSIAGVNQPAPITITGLPPCFQILKAYLYCGGSGNGIAVTASVTNPAATNSLFPMTLIGSHVDKCWGYVGTRNYRADITALITGNGNYMVSGIPTNPPTAGNDMDGASIIIIYADPTQNWTGSIVIGDGCQVGIGGTQTNTLTGFTSCGASTFAQGFYIVSDMQNVGTFPMKMNNAAFNFTYANGIQNWWDYCVGPASPVTAGQNSFPFGVSSSNDCYNIVVEGMYWRTTCNVCTVSNLTITPIVTSTCTIGSATAVVTGGNAPYSYTWTPSAATTSAINSVAPGSYTVTVKDATGCFTGTAVVLIPANVTTLAVNSSTICYGKTTTLTAVGVMNSYTWTPGNTLNTTGGPVVIANPTTTTIYTVSATNSLGCIGSAISTVVVNPLPIIAVNNPTACLNTSFTLTSNGGSAYSWVGPNAYTSALQNPIFAVASPSLNGNYTVMVTSLQGCTQTAVANVSVVMLPTVSIVGTQTLCSHNFNGSTNSVVISASGANSYTWNLPIGFTAFPSLNLSTFTLNPPTTSAPINSLISVIGTGPGGCTNIAVYNIGVIPNPTISVTTASMCFGTSAILTATGATTYLWAPSNSLSSPFGSSVTATPSVTTIYGIVGSSLNCNSITQLITVTVVPNPVIIISPANPTICAGSNINLVATGATNYTWSPSNSLNSANGSTVNANPAITTNYTIIGEAATCTSVATKQLIVIPLPTLQALASKTVLCIGEKVNINANGASSYTWSPVNEFGNSITVSPNASTTYYLIGNNGMCTATLSVPITVLPKPVLELSTNPQKICFGYSTTINASGAQSYSWSPSPNSLNLGGNLATVSPTASTNYTVMGINYAGTVACMMTKEILIDIIPTIVASVNGSVEICQGQTVKLNASGSNTYFWNPSDGLNNSLIANPNANPRSTTLYTVYISDGGYCRVSSSVLVKVNPQPTVNTGPDLIFNSDEPMYLKAIGTGTITWILGDGILCHDCPNSQVITRIGGNYIAQTINQYGCKSTDDLNIEVTNYYSIYIPNVFTPNFDDINDTFLVYGVGISNVEMSIFDRWGEKLFNSKEQLKGWDGTYKGEFCKSDVYTYTVNFTSLDGKKHTKSGHVSLLK